MPTPAPAPSVVAQGTFTLSDPATAVSNDSVCDIIEFIPFTTPTTGRLDVTVDWTFASNNIDIFLERGNCTCAMVFANQCSDLTGSQTMVKPETLRMTNLAAGTYTLAVLNAGPTGESGSYQLVLTH